MPLAALGLVLAAALLHAWWNVLAKKAGGDTRFALLSGLAMALVWAPVGILLGWTVVPTWGVLEWGLLAASAVTHVLYFVTLLRGYRLSDLTVVYPLARGTGPLLSSLAAVLFLGERLSLVGGLGVLVLVGGVFLVAGGPKLLRAAQHNDDPVARARVRRGVGYGVLTGGFIASYTLVDGYAVRMALLSPILLDYFGNLLRLPLYAMAAWPQREGLWEEWQRTWKPALAIGMLSPIAYTLVLYAMTLAPLSHVAPAREVSMLFAALIGGHLLGEGNRVWRVIGASMIACGVAALALG